MHEWNTVMHNYFGPFLHSIGADSHVLNMLLDLLDGFGISAQDVGVTGDEISLIRSSFSQFCVQWESLYIRDDGELLPRARLSLHLLLHIADLIHRTGSLRASSQAACERTLGTIKQELRSTRDPYISVENRVIMLEQSYSLEVMADTESIGNVRRWNTDTDADVDDSIELGPGIGRSAVETVLPSNITLAGVRRALEDVGLKMQETTFLQLLTSPGTVIKSGFDLGAVSPERHGGSHVTSLGWTVPVLQVRLTGTSCSLLTVRRTTLS